MLHPTPIQSIQPESKRWTHLLIRDHIGSHSSESRSVANVRIRRRRDGRIQEFCGAKVSKFRASGSTGLPMNKKRKARNLNPNYPSHLECVVLIRILLVSIGLLLATPAVTHAQAISSWSRAGSRAELPRPVRPNHTQQVTHTVVHPNHMPSEFQTRSLVGSPQTVTQGNPQLQPHDLLRSPAQTAHPRAGGRHSNSGGKHSNHWAWLHQKKHHPIQPPAALLPESNSRPVWKTPFSYGHFGASGTRHWSTHHGYRDRTVEWRFW